MPESASLLCHRCGAILTPGRGDFYVINVEAYADPSPPLLSEQEMPQHPGVKLAELAMQMEGYSEAELMDFVYRKFTFYLCHRCYRQWIEHPAG